MRPSIADERGRRRARARRRTHGVRAAQWEATPTITWNAARYPLVVVRDAKTGEILSFARGGSATVETAASDLELTLSDGVASTVLQSHVAQ